MKTSLRAQPLTLAFFVRRRTTVGVARRQWFARSRIGNKAMTESCLGESHAGSIPTADGLHCAQALPESCLGESHEVSKEWAHCHLTSDGDEPCNRWRKNTGWTGSPKRVRAGDDPARRRSHTGLGGHVPISERHVICMLCVAYLSWPMRPLAKHSSEHVVVTYPSFCHGTSDIGVQELRNRFVTCGAQALHLHSIT